MESIRYLAFNFVHATLYVTMSVRPLVRRSVSPSVSRLEITLSKIIFFGCLELKGQQI